MAINRSEIAYDVSVLIGLVIITVLALWVHFSSPFLAIGPLSNTKSRALTIGITVFATTFTGIIASQIQHGLIRSLEERLQSVSEEPFSPQHCAGQDIDPRHEEIQQIERNWRSIVRIDSIPEKFKNYQFSLLFLFSSLITTAIVTTSTSSLANKLVSYQAVIPGADVGVFSEELNRSCFGICNPPCPTFRSAFSWVFDNGTEFEAADDGDCPCTYIIQLSAGINTDTPDDHVYVQSGVAVERGAIGTPTSVFSGNTFGNISAEYGQALVNTTQCVPVMISNPVRCQLSGQMTIVQPNEITMTTGNLTLPGTIWDVPSWNETQTAGLSRNFDHDSGRPNVIGSVYSRDTHTGITVLGFGAFTDVDGTVPFASYLAGAVNDPDLSAGKAPGSHYLSGGKPCTQADPTIGDKLFATAGIASYQLVRENHGVDGYFATLARLSGNRRGGPYAFPDSTNALEDVLGIVSGLAASKIPLDGTGVSAATVEDPEGLFGALVEATRVGAASNEAIWLLIPLMGSSLILLALFILGLRLQWAPGGSKFRGGPEDRPKLYAAENIRRLVGLRVVVATPDYGN